MKHINNPEIGPIRQGDIFLVPVGALPSQAREVPIVGNRIVLAEGEATGRAHVIDHAEEIAAKAWSLGAEIFVSVEKLAPARHEEHAWSPMVPGIVYRREPQREYHPEEIRNVAD